MNYIFFDAVWYQQGGGFCLTSTQLLEINAMIVTDGFTKEQRYHSQICPDEPERIPVQKLAFLRQERSKLERGKGVRVVLDDIVTRFPHDLVLVIWKRRTYEVFVSACEKNQIKIPEHRLVVLDELLAAIDYYASDSKYHLEQALRRYHVKFVPEQTYCSEDRVYLLKKLYCSAKFYYRQSCELDPEARPILYDITNKIHGRDCLYITSEAYEQGKIRSGINSLWDGTQLCSHCLKNGAFQRMKEEIPFVKVEKTKNVEKYVQTLCKRLNLECEFANGVVFVRSSYGRWRLYYNNGRVEKVYHENYRFHIRDGFEKNHKFRDGYHRQQMSSGTFYEILMYIARHDRKFLKREVSSTSFH